MRLPFATQTSNSYVIHTFIGSCNSRCAWCLLQYDLSRNYEKGKITLSQFRRFLELNAECKKPLIPYGLGEPTIHEDFVPFCRLVLDKGWVLESIHTNLSKPNLSVSVLSMLTRFRSVTVNVGGATEATQRLNMETSLQETKSNLTHLISLKQTSNSKVQITVKMVLNKNNVEEVGKLKELFSDFHVPVETYPLYFSVSDGSPEERKLFYERNLMLLGGKMDRRVLCRDHVVLREGVVSVSSKLKKCYGLIPTIHVNGEVSVCCRSRWYGGYVGNAFEKSMREIMASEAYKQAVKLALRRQYVEYCKYCS